MKVIISNLTEFWRKGDKLNRLLSHKAIANMANCHVRVILYEKWTKHLRQRTPPIPLTFHNMYHSLKDFFSFILLLLSATVSCHRHMRKWKKLRVNQKVISYDKPLGAKTHRHSHTNRVDFIFYQSKNIFSYVNQREFSSQKCS